MGKNRFGCLAATLCVLLAFSILLNLVLVSRKARHFAGPRPRAAPAPEFEEETVLNGSDSSSDKIALIPVRGLIGASIEGTLGETMVDDLKIELREALEDKHV